MAPDVLVALVTCPPEKAQSLAELLVNERVAACVNVVGGVQSVYRWQGAVQHDVEALLVCKTTRDRFEAFRNLVLENHPYELPEVIALPVGLGHVPYLEWVMESTR